MADKDYKTEIATITSILNKSSLEEPVINMVLQRLSFLGYEYQEDDAYGLSFAIQKVENHIKNSCNTTSIPDELIEIAVDRICGEFLFVKKQTGKLNSDVFDLEVAVKQVQAGDTSVTFAIGEGSETPETRLNKLLSYLMTVGEGDFVCYRKIKW